MGRPMSMTSRIKELIYDFHPLTSQLAKKGFCCIVVPHDGNLVRIFPQSTLYLIIANVFLFSIRMVNSGQNSLGKFKIEQ